jgi:hypothetical protein
MGVKYGGGEVFEPVAKRLLDYNAPDYVVTDICAVLIEQLQDLAWENEGATLAAFCEHPAVVEAFAKREVFLTNDPRNPDFEEFRKEHLEHVKLLGNCPSGGSCRYCYAKITEERNDMT